MTLENFNLNEAGEANKTGETDNGQSICLTPRMAMALIEAYPHLEGRIRPAHL